MTLLGKDLSVARRALQGLRGKIFPTPTPNPAGRSTWIVSHRGDCEGSAENTLSACQHAIEAGADGFEVDVCITRDGKLVLWHDPDPDDPLAIARQYGLEGLQYVPRVPGFGSELRRPVSALDYECFHHHYGYVRACDARRSLLGIEPGERMPPERLEPLLTWAAGHPQVRLVLLDIKLEVDELALVPALIDGLRDLQRATGIDGGQRMCLMVRERELYERVKGELASRPELRAWRLIADFELPGVTEVAEGMQARHVAIGNTARRLWSAVREDIVRALYARCDGKLDSVTVWTFERPDILGELMALGVDAVITKDCALASQIKRAIGQTVPS